MATSGGGRHPVFALWPLEAGAALANYLARQPERRVAAFAQTLGIVQVEFGPEVAGGHATDPFFNINTPADLRAAETMLGGPDRRAPIR